MKINLLALLRSSLGLLLGGLTLVSPAAAASNAPAPAEPPKAIAYRVSPADKLGIFVIGEPDLSSGNRRVDANGNVNLPYVNDVRVGGLTVPEAQTAVENAYKEGRFLRNPQVSINVEEYSPREVSISGMIKNGGKYPLPPETVMTLTALVLKAGGFQDTANGSKVRLTRTNADGTTRIFVLDIDSVIRSKDTKNSTDGSFVLEPGDLVYVPEKMI